MSVTTLDVVAVVVNVVWLGEYFLFVIIRATDTRAREAKKELAPGPRRSVDNPLYHHFGITLTRRICSALGCEKLLGTLPRF